MLLQYMTETGKSVSELAADIPSYSMIKTKFPCPAGVAEQVTAAARDAFIDEPQAAFNDADGLRIDLPDAWVCVRASNTEPIMRIIAEAPSEDQANALIARVRAIADDIIG
jgi:phosphomannomutase